MRPYFANLILTRPKAASLAFLDRLGADVPAGLNVILSPLISIESLGQAVDLKGISGVIFSSSNGVAFTGPGAGLPAYCVGFATTQAAKDAGWDASFCGENADELVERLIHDRPATPLLHLCGRHQRGNIAGRLSQADVPTTALEVYDQRAQPLTQDAQQALAGNTACVLPLFSILYCNIKKT